MSIILFLRSNMLLTLSSLTVKLDVILAFAVANRSVFQNAARNVPCNDASISPSLVNDFIESRRQ